MTLHQDDLKTTTTIRADAAFDSDRLWLNGKEESIPTNKRLVNCLAASRKARAELEAENPALPKLADQKLHICSINNFPTAAGLASSASGYAALVFALVSLYELPMSPSEVSKLARLGSGSACRSIFGGFVAWEMGSLADGSDSMAVQVAPETHWPLHALILVVSDAKKGVGSTEGMQETVATSDLLQHRIAHSVPKRMEDMKRAILEKDFDLFAETTMKDSNQFHATCLDTFPPIFYLNDVSRAIIQLVHRFNDFYKKQGKGYQVSYTFDAGPNAVIYGMEESLKEFLGVVARIFPKPEGAVDAEYYGKSSLIDAANDSRADKVVEELKFPVQSAGGIRRVIGTRVGPGPSVLARGWGSESLLDESGMPRF